MRALYAGLLVVAGVILGRITTRPGKFEEKVKAEFAEDKAAATKLYDSAKAKFCKKEQAREEPEEQPQAE